MTNKRSITSSIGLGISFIGMAGLVLSIVSLLPLNAYNIYKSVTTLTKLLYFELENNHNDWHSVSVDTKLYFTFLCGSVFSSLLEMVTTFIACCNQSSRESPIVIVDESNSKQHQETQTHPHYQPKKSWFIRFTCFTILIQIIFSLFGTHLLYSIKSDLIPKDIQYDAFISCTILWINYVSLILFSFIMLFASFCILIGACNNTRAQKSPYQSGSRLDDDETRPLIIV